MVVETAGQDKISGIAPMLSACQHFPAPFARHSGGIFLGKGGGLYKPDGTERRQVNPPSPRLQCAVCLWMIGYGYDRISNKVALDKQRVAKFIGLRKKKGSVSRTMTVKWCPPKAPPKPPKDPLIKAAKTIESKRYVRQATALRRCVWRWLFVYKTSPIAESMVGCSRDQFRAHIQSRFRRGMAWNNYGSVWELDHIQPCRTFNLSNPQDIRRCFHFSNYQPLLITHNRSKSDKNTTHQPELTISFVPDARRFNSCKADQPAPRANRETGNSLGTGPCLILEHPQSPSTQPSGTPSAEQVAAPGV